MAETETKGDLIERPSLRVVFQRGFVPEVGINGCRVEDVIAVAIERLDKYQQGRLACTENEEAIRALYTATNALKSRIQRRQEQGVFNTAAPHARTEDEHEDFSATGA